MSIHRGQDGSYAVINLKEKAGALVTFTSRSSLDNQIGEISVKGTTKGGHKIRFWGKKNNLPQWREQLVNENNIVPALIYTKRNITYGSGIFAYEKIFKEDGGKANIKEVRMPSEVEDFFGANDIECYLIDAVTQFYLHANVFTEFILTKDKTRVASIRCIDCKYVRLGEQDSKGHVKKAYISGSWGKKTMPEDSIVEVPLLRHPFDLTNPEELKNLPAKFIYHTGDTFFNDGYYNSPYWFGSKEWIQLANTIPQFHQYNIENGYTFRFHIKIPKGYFYKQPEGSAPEALKKALDNEIAAREEFLESFNNFFSGAPGAGRALMTQFDMNNWTNQHFPGITIEPITYDMKDEALLKLFEKSNTANISAQTIHPTLANIETQGKLSSGSEIRNAFMMYLAIHTPVPRRLVLKAIDLVKTINKWDSKIHFGFGDIEITTLDNEPTGHREAVVAPATGEDENA